MDVFHQNLDKWSKKWAIICPTDTLTVDRLKSSKSSKSVRFCTADSGLPNLFCQVTLEDGEEKAFHLHTQKDPLAEANEWFASLDLKEIQILYVYGIGLGYYHNAAQAWLKGDKNRYLIFLEDDEDIFRCFLETEAAGTLLDDPQTIICLLGARNDQILRFTRLTILFHEKSFFTGLRSYAAEKQKLYSEFRYTISFMNTMNKMLQAESSTHGLVFFRNFFLNFLNIQGSYLANGLLNKFEGVPAIICGAGPSLNKNIDVLASLHDRALIFAGGTALNALNGKGVMPHIGVGIDPNPDQFTRLVMNQAFELPFLYRNRMLHEALQAVHGDKLYLTGTGGYPVGKWIEKELGVDEYELEEGFNVLNFSLMIAHAMGCKPIICAGIDLAYSAGDSYAEGVSNHPIHSRKSNFRTKKITDELVSKADIYGRPIFTLWKWIAESLWYTHFASAHPDCTLINATEGGIGFIYVPNMTLEEVKQKYLTKQYDLRGWLHGEIQNSPLPETFRPEKIVKLIRELMDSVVRCGDCCQKLVTALANAIEQRSGNDDMTKLLAQAEEQLKNETAYDVVLKRFDEDLLKNNERVRIRLEEDKENLPEKEYAKQKAILNLERHHSLKETTLLNASIVYEMLDLREGQEKKQRTEERTKEERIEALRRQYPLPIQRPEEHYQCDAETFQMIDPELNLNFQEALSKEKPLRKVALFYPSQKLKFEEYYAGDTLHGPSTFYAENGQILHQSWFVHGIQEGKTRAYHANGSLHSLQLFKDGQLTGIQRYFYSDGLIKSVLPYKNGKLEGEVFLYSPEGVLIRHLSFVEGKRMGLEQIWNEAGQLLIECNYEADEPVGYARMWHANGQLAKEILYDSESKRIEAKEWDTQGVLVEEEESEDYFDQVNKETDKLTASLSDLVVKMSEITPFISEKFLFKNSSVMKEGAKESQKEELAVELEKLKHEMEHLQALDQKLKEHLADENGRAKEAIWKTPASREHMEKQFELRQEQMKTDMEKIQQGIKSVLDSLLDKE